jgi:hypothetical protein
VLVSSHLGTSLPVWLFSRIFPKLHYIAAQNVNLLGNQLPCRPIALSNISTKGQRQLSAALRDGCPIILANDQLPIPTESGRTPNVEVTHFGVTHKFLPLVPRLAQSRNIPTFWVQGLHQNKRIQIQLERLPDPNPNEDSNEWGHRWTDAYVKHLEIIMTGPPENVAPNAPAWNRFMCLPRTLR